MGASGQDWSHANSCSNTIDQARLPTSKAPWLAEEALHYSHAAEPQRGGNQRRHDGGIGQTCVLRYPWAVCTYIISFSPDSEQCGLGLPSTIAFHWFVARSMRRAVQESGYPIGSDGAKACSWPAISSTFRVAYSSPRRYVRSAKSTHAKIQMDMR